MGRVEAFLLGVLGGLIAGVLLVSWAVAAMSTTGMT